MKRRIGAVVTIAVFALALWFLHKTAAKFDPDEVGRQLAAIPHSTILLSIACGMGSYLFLGGFDYLAIRHLRQPVPAWRIFFTSFVSHAITHSTGFAALTGGAVRYRMYVAAGLSPLQVAGVVAFCGVTFALGAWSLMAATLLIAPDRIAPAVNLPPNLLWSIGIGLLVLLAGYFAWGGFLRRPVRLFGRQFEMPSPAMGLKQLIVAAIDLTFAAAALWVLLPEGAVSLPAFVGIYVAANLSGLLAHVPGGIGVFDAVILVLTPNVPGEAVVGALLVFRVVYNLLPLIMGLTLLVAYELLDRVPAFHQAIKGAGGWIEDLAGPLLATVTFLAGAAFLVVGAIPLGSDALHSVPARLGASICGAVLLVQARGLNRGLLAPLVLCILTLGIGITIIALDGFYLLAGLCALPLVALMSSGPLFRASGLRLAILTAPWVAAASVAILGALWLSLYLSRQNGVQGLWWPTALASLIVLGYALLSLVSFVRGKPLHLQA